MLKLTARQKMAYELRHLTDPPMEWAEIGRRMECAKSAAMTAYKAAIFKQARLDGFIPKARSNVTARPTEVIDPEKAALFFDTLTDPIQARSIARIAKEEGLTASGFEGFIKRINGRYSKTKKAIEQVKTSELLNLVSDKAKRILESIDEEDFARAGLKDKAIAAGIFIDKRRLLSGEPTQIISFEERRHLDEIMPKLLLEAQRRGFVIDVDPISTETRVVDRDAIPAAVAVTKERERGD